MHQLIGGETFDNRGQSAFGGQDNDRNRLPSTNNANYGFSDESEDYYGEEDNPDYVNGNIANLVEGKLRTDSMIER